MHNDRHNASETVEDISAFIKETNPEIETPPAAAVEVVTTGNDAEGELRDEVEVANAMAALADGGVLLAEGLCNDHLFNVLMNEISCFRFPHSSISRITWYRFEVF